MTFWSNFKAVVKASGATAARSMEMLSDAANILESSAGKFSLRTRIYSLKTSLNSHKESGPEKDRVFTEILATYDELLLVCAEHEVAAIRDERQELTLTKQHDSVEKLSRLIEQKRSYINSTAYPRSIDEILARVELVRCLEDRSAAYRTIGNSDRLDMREIEENRLLMKDLERKRYTVKEEYFTGGGPKRRAEYRDGTICGAYQTWHENGYSFIDAQVDLSRRSCEVHTRYGNGQTLLTGSLLGTEMSVVGLYLDESKFIELTSPSNGTVVVKVFAPGNTYLATFQFSSFGEVVRSADRMRSRLVMNPRVYIFFIKSLVTGSKERNQKMFSAAADAFKGLDEEIEIILESR